VQFRRLPLRPTIITVIVGTAIITACAAKPQSEEVEKPANFAGFSVSSSCADKIH
jgi:uncharacterized lipoprotein YajG